MLTECEHADDFLKRVFGVRRQGRQQTHRPDEVFCERQYDDGHFCRTYVHDTHPRIYETRQWPPEFVHVGERGLIKAELAARFVDNRAQFGVRQRSCTRDQRCTIKHNNKRLRFDEISYNFRLLD